MRFTSDDVLCRMSGPFRGSSFDMPAFRSVDNISRVTQMLSVSHRLTDRGAVLEMQGTKVTLHVFRLFMLESTTYVVFLHSLHLSLAPEYYLGRQHYIFATPSTVFRYSLDASVDDPCCNQAGHHCPFSSGYRRSPHEIRGLSCLITSLDQVGRIVCRQVRFAGFTSGVPFLYCSDTATTLAVSSSYEAKGMCTYALK